MEENNLKTYFTSYAYLCKDFVNNYEEILIILNIVNNHLKNKELFEFFYNDAKNIYDYLNKKTNTFNVPLPEKYILYGHYINIYHKFIININIYNKNDINQNNKYFKDFLEFMEMTSDLVYFQINNLNDKITLLLLIYIPLYSLYII
jgi:hypothetical protein